MPCLGTIKQFVSPKIEQKKGRGRCIEGCVGHFSDPLFMKIFHSFNPWQIKMTLEFSSKKQQFSEFFEFLAHGHVVPQ